MQKFKRFINEENNRPESKISRLEKAVAQIEKVAKKPSAAKKEAIKKPGSKWATPKATGTTVMVFGRMNPVTAGHEKLVQQAQKHAERLGGKLKVIVSHSDGDANNPLDQKTKLKHLKRAFPNIKIDTAEKGQSSIMHHVKRAYDDGTKDLVVMASGARVKEFQTVLNNYNGAPNPGYKFRSIKVIDAGKGAGIVSGTEARDTAQTGDFQRFRAGLPSTIAPNFVHSRELFNDTVRAMKKHNRPKKK